MNRLTVLLLVLLLLASCAAPSLTPVPATGAALSSTAVPATGPVAASPTPTAARPSPTPTGTPAPTPAPTAAAIADVIEWEMRGSFDFFWEQANTDPGSPGYGLIRDRYPGSEGIASIAAVGFGLTAYVIGAEKGYVTRDEACERAAGTLATLLTLDREHGFYFHFLDVQSGKRAWQSEVSTIDTALLLMGVLTAGQYCGGEVQARAEEIYAGVDWPWFVDPDRNTFSMAYRPGEGFSGHWDFYAEQLILYILAAGSPTHPIDPVVYYTFTRHTASYGDGRPFIHSWFGSLFTYQFSHAWIDFRGLRDREGADWFENSVEASLAHYNFAVAMDDTYVGLGPRAWGLTACDSPHGYEGRYGAPPCGYDDRQHLVDDTIAPAGAIGSIVFLPAQAEQAMLYYYSFQELQGPYGFRDAFNLTEGWFAGDVIGIDKGISLLMLANYQNDMVYAVTMRNEHLRDGLERLGITR